MLSVVAVTCGPRYAARQPSCSHDHVVCSACAAFLRFVIGACLSVNIAYSNMHCYRYIALLQVKSCNLVSCMLLFSFIFLVRSYLSPRLPRYVLFGLLPSLATPSELVDSLLLHFPLYRLVLVLSASYSVSSHASYITLTPSSTPLLTSTCRFDISY